MSPRRALLCLLTATLACGSKAPAHEGDRPSSEATGGERTGAADSDEEGGEQDDPAPPATPRGDPDYRAGLETICNAEQLSGAPAGGTTGERLDHLAPWLVTALSDPWARALLARVGDLEPPRRVELLRHEASEEDLEACPLADLIEEHARSQPASEPPHDPDPQRTAQEQPATHGTAAE